MIRIIFMVAFVSLSTSVAKARVICGEVKKTSSKDKKLLYKVSLKSPETVKKSNGELKFESINSKKINIEYNFNSFEDYTLFKMANHGMIKGLKQFRKVYVCTDRKNMGVAYSKEEALKDLSDNFLEDAYSSLKMNIETFSDLVSTDKHNVNSGEFSRDNNKNMINTEEGGYSRSNVVSQ